MITRVRPPIAFWISSSCLIRLSPSPASADAVIVSPHALIARRCLPGPLHSPLVLLDCISSKDYSTVMGHVDHATRRKGHHSCPRPGNSHHPVSTVISIHTSAQRCPSDTARARLLLGNLDGSIVDALDNVVGVLAVNGASDRLGRAEDLLDGAGERLGERLGGELSGDLQGATMSDGSPP